MKPFLHTEGLAVGYNGRPLLEEVCLAVRRGEILTLIGPNGAGKSTILKTIARQLTPIRGTVYLDGDSVWGMPEGELAKRLALVTTGRVDPELMTCLDVVETGRYPYTGRLGILSREDRRIAAEALAQVGGEALAERPFACISDGQRQRILLARALCQQPDVIVLDEPTSYLDIRHKLELLNLLKRLVHQKQLAVVMSLHELDLAQRVSDTVVCVNGSCIERCGTPEAIFTADYIRRLYGLTGGSYEPVFGSVELEAVPGPPRVFVIGGGAAVCRCTGGFSGRALPLPRAFWRRMTWIIPPRRRWPPVWWRRRPMRRSALRRWKRPNKRSAPVKVRCVRCRSSAR